MDGEERESSLVQPSDESGYNTFTNIEENKNGDQSE